MNEKQRWLLRDLDAWQEKQFDRTGRYGAMPDAKPPASVVAAKRLIARASAVVAEWERAEKKKGEAARSAVNAIYRDTKRLIIFDKPQVALKAITALLKKK